VPRRDPVVTVVPVPTPSAPPVAGPYSPAVRAGDWVVLAGQVGFGSDGGLVSGGVEAETRQVLANIAGILGDCGADWSHVAKVAIFLTDLGNFATVNALYEGAIGPHRPARTTVAVAELPGGATVEIECWAYQPANEPDDQE
jgi:2-iminobutanoate/2-iminopropanoate deaminase